MNIPKTIGPLCAKLRKMPKWVWWAGGILIALVYCLCRYLFLVAPSGFRWRAIYGDPDYPDGYEIHGVDISHHQGTVNWARLRNALIEQSPVRFVFMKSTEGDSHVDRNFRINFINAKESGLIRGAYHFWSNSSSPRRQAYFYLAMTPLEAGDLPPVLDIETKPTNISTEEFQQNILTWLHIVEDKFHVKPIIYTYYKFKDQYLSDSRFDDYPYWIAHYYVHKMEYLGKWLFWQHTDAGKLPGIKGYVDLNIFNGSYYNLMQLLIPETNSVEMSDTPICDSTSVDSFSVQD